MSLKNRSTETARFDRERHGLRLAGEIRDAVDRGRASARVADLLDLGHSASGRAATEA
jgi:hypothetical protein